MHISHSLEYWLFYCVYLFSSLIPNASQPKLFLYLHTVLLTSNKVDFEKATMRNHYSDPSVAQQIPTKHLLHVNSSMWIPEKWILRRSPEGNSLKQWKLKGLKMSGGFWNRECLLCTRYFVTTTKKEAE